MLQQIINLVCLRKLRVKLLQKKFAKCLEDEFAEEFLEILLKLMSLVFCLDQSFRRNIKGFAARYLFKSKDSGVTVGVQFADNKMTVQEKELKDTNITVIFRDQQTLMRFLLAPKADILQALLNQDIYYEGNINYLAKFAFMAKHLQLEVKGIFSG
jgi:hypothetical protein